MQLQDIALIVLGTIIVIGYGYSMDMPQALQSPLRGSPYLLDSVEFNMLYFATYLPILITDIPLGIILDKFPLQKTVVVIALTSFIAELFTAILFDFRPQGYLYLVLVLRAFVGMAGSSAFTMQGFIFARYAGQHFQMLMGFGLCVPFVFDAINATITPIIFDATHSISLPWYIASCIDFLSVIAALIISWIIKRKQKRRQDKLTVQQQQQQNEEQQQQFKASYLLQLPPLFWLLNLTVLANQVSMGIYSNLNDLISNRFNISYVTTGQILLIPYVFGSALALIFGKIILMKPTSRRFIILFSAICTIVAFIIIYFLPNNQKIDDPTVFDYFAIIMFLMLFSVLVGTLYTVLGSSMSLLVDKKRLGTAWGVYGTAIGLGESVCPIINGFIQDDNDLPNSYRSLTFIYMLTSIIPVLLGLYIFFGPFAVIDVSFDQVHGDKPKQILQNQQIEQQTITASLLTQTQQ